MFRLVAMLAAVMFLMMPADCWGQVGAGIGIQGVGGGGGGQLGPPPAGVLLHQQYMQLYGLPTTFTQSQTNNGGGQGGIAALGAYGGGGGYGRPGGRIFGVNYQRNMMAAQAYMAAANVARIQNPNPSGYGLSAYNAPQPNFSGSFGMAQGNGQNPFLSTFPAPSNGTASNGPRFQGFGLTGFQPANTLAPLASKDDDKKEEKKQEKQESK